jgi:hypothetical protein
VRRGAKSNLRRSSFPSPGPISSNCFADPSPLGVNQANRESPLCSLDQPVTTLVDTNGANGVELRHSQPLFSRAGFADGLVGCGASPPLSALCRDFAVLQGVYRDFGNFRPGEIGNTDAFLPIVALIPCTRNSEFI